MSIRHAIGVIFAIVIGIQLPAEGSTSFLKISYQKKETIMLKNYFIIAFRNFWRNKVFSTINVLGLSIGISAALVIFLIVYYEFSFDKFEQDADRIYRVVLDAKFNGTEGHSAAVPAPLSSAIQNEVTGIDKTVPVMQFQGDATAKVSIAGNSGKPVVYKKEPNIVFTNQQYFQLLPYQWLAGPQQTSLKDPFTVVLTESRAQLYFPGITTSDIIGKQVTYNDITVTVSGIVKDLNEHTAFAAGEFISFPTISKTNLQDQFMMNVWNDWMAYSQLYIKISKGNTPEKTEAQLKDLFKKYNKDANKDVNNTIAFHLQPLNDIHFNMDYQGVGYRIAHKPTLYGLLGIAGFLLLLGCINFINLTTAQSSHRAKEIGVRKTMGGSKKNLIFQFLSETFFLTIIATILSVILTPVLLKVFEDFIPEGLHFDLLHQPYLIWFLVLLTITVCFLSGLYPALILSGYKPVLVLRNQAFTGSNQTRNARVRKTLTVSQFVIAQFFVIATVMVSKQINYSLNADMGFKKDAILSFDVPRSDTIPNHRAQLLNEIKAIPGVQMASRGFLTPADEGEAFSDIKYTDGKKEVVANVQIRWGDTNYLKLFQIKLLAGRNIEQSDTIKEFLINETYARMMGFQHPEAALNKQLDFNGKKILVVGVMHDFHEQSLHSVLGPVVFASFNDRSYFFHIALKPQNAAATLWQSTIGKIQKEYKQIYPDEDFNYKIFDDTIAKFYEREQNTSSLLKWATGLAIFISCLGLLGLVIYTTNTRTKEIGIRKVLGASVANIVSILSKDFIQLILIAFVIAAPIAWWAAYKWLQDYAYRTTISWWVFVVSGIAMMVIALITLSIQTIKAAIANPVKSLRTE
jgi:putative ABC transport system permease protein